MKWRRKTGLLCFLLCFLLISGSRMVHAEKISEVADQIDIDALQKELEALDEDMTYPDFSVIYEAIMDFRFLDVIEELGQWLMEKVTYEITSSWTFMGELAGVILFSALFSNISLTFSQFAVGDSGFLVSYFIVFSILFSNFSMMAELFQSTVKMLSALLKIVIPVYTLSVTFSGNLSSGVVFYEYFMILVLAINRICLVVILPLIQYYLLLEMLNHFSGRQPLARLCKSLYFVLSKGMKVLFTAFFGFHLLETMVVPSFDTTKNVVLNRVLGLIPGAGSLAETVTGTLIGSAVLIKNTLGASVILFILCMLLFPVVKLLLTILFYVLLSILLEPVADERLLGCITAAQRSGVLLVYTLCFAGALFVLTIAVTSFATNGS